MLLLEGIGNVSLTSDNSSPILGPVGELNSTYSVNNHNPNTLKIEDSMIESQWQRPKRMKSWKKRQKRVGLSGFLNCLSLAVVKALDMHPSNYDDGCDCRVSNI